MSENPFDYRQARAYASHFGLWIGLMWIVSFVCSMRSVDHMLLGHLGNIMALLSFLALVRQVKNYRYLISDMSLLQCCWMCFTICIYAGLITTGVQALYFHFFDNGHLADSLSNMFAQEEYRILFEQYLAGQKPEDVIEMIQGMSISDIIVQMMTINLTISMLFAIFGGMLAYRGKVRQTE